MIVSTTCLWSPKAGMGTHEYEDAFAPEAVSNHHCRIFRCAVADGATETSFAGLWAGLLARAYACGSLAIDDLRARWLAEAGGQSLPWYAEEKVRLGAYATLVGLTLSDDGAELRWAAEALGDSCLFHVREGRILQAFPLDDWRLFGNSPALISSCGTAGLHLDSAGGQFQPGDIFILCSDAISAWILRKQEAGQPAISAMLQAGGTAEQFEEFVASQRSEKDPAAGMRNDDVTALIVRVQARS